MFTPDNYYAKIKDIDFSTLPEVLRKGHEFTDKVSNNGSDWANYHASSTVRKAIDGYFLKLAEYINTHKKAASPAKPRKAKTAKKENSKPPKHVKQHENTRQPVMVERIPDDVRIIKRFVNMQFKTLGFTGKWLELIGDPSANFTAMVYGKPKFGKSYLCIDFAGYLARHHGRVLYVAREEGLDKTLQDKIKGKNVKHPNLIFASRLPSSLSGYDFIFLDSVTKLGLTTDDLEELKHANPTKSFIYIFQTTKDGNFRGVNGFQHDVDVVIEVPERGRAVQNGRFNQGGEIQIF